MPADSDRIGAQARATATGTALLAFYRAAGERSMRDLPIYHASLDFAAVGFCAHDDRALGIIVTPWFMNLILAPLDGSDGQRPGATVARGLPAGTFEFSVCALDGIGLIESCSLFSPMFEFADHAAALATAEAVLAAVLDPQFDAAAAADGGAGPAKAAPAEVAIDRRRFLRGAVSGAGR
jgi:[NiFe] hydrogenase assembly HybE family chaperone